MAKVWHRHRASGDDWIVDIRDRDGVRRRFSTSSRSEAEALLVDKTNEYREPEKPELTEKTIDEYAQAWLQDITTEGAVKPRTITSYRQLYRLHIAPTLGAIKLRDLSRRDVKDLLNAKREQISKDGRKLSKNTVRLIRATLSVMLAEAIDDGDIESNPTTITVRKKGKKKAAAPPMHPFEETELNRLLEAARVRDPEYFPLFLLLARTGIRPGKAFALEWADLDFPKRKLSVDRALSAGIIGTTKTGTTREVDMSQELADALAALYRVREAQTLKHQWGEVPELIFVNAERGCLDESRVRKRFARVLKAAGVGGHRLYDLRHTFASILLQNGAPITYVSAMLGHANSTTTLSWYAQWLPKSGKSYVDSLDSASLAPKRPNVGTKLRTGTDNMPPMAENATDSLENFGGPFRARTGDPLIKSQLLYQLS
jgi:integrase